MSLMMTEDNDQIEPPSEIGPWDPVLAQLRAWDLDWADSCIKMTTNPWGSSVLPRKTVELISVALTAACTNLNPDGTRRHIRAALKAGATRARSWWCSRWPPSFRSTPAAWARPFCWKRR